jgi:glycine C-acetyltransferase
MSNDALAWIDEELAKLTEAGLRTTIRTIESPMDGWVTIDGRKLLNFCANNYLGLANHPRLRAAAQGHRRWASVLARCAPSPARPPCM